GPIPLPASGHGSATLARSARRPPPASPDEPRGLGRECPKRSWPCQGGSIMDSTSRTARHRFICDKPSFAIWAEGRPARLRGIARRATAPTDYDGGVEFDRWLAESLARNGMTQTEAAARLGVSFRTLNRWIRGQ